jgi:hypothetical protein
VNRAADARVWANSAGAAADGIVAFLLLAALLVIVFGHTERVEFASYALTFFVLLPTLMVTSWRRERRSPVRAADAPAAALRVATALAAILAARLVWVVSPGAVGVAVVAACAAALLMALRVAGNPRSLTAFERLTDKRRVLEPAAVLLLGAALAAFLPASVLAGNDWLVFVVTLAIAAALIVAFRQQSTAPGTRRAIDVLVILLLVPALLVVRGQDIPDATFHQGFFLAPANSVLHGRVVLVNVFSQYGVGLIYFLAAIFAVIGIGYGLISIVAAVLAMFELAVLYLVLRLVVRSQGLAVAALAVAIVASVLTQELLYVDAPSTGALRFGLPFLLILVEVVAISRHRRRSLASWTSAALIGLASLWSFETFFYTVLAYISIVGLQAAQRRRPVYLVRMSAPPLVAIVAVQAGYAAITKVVAGAWPDWGTYFAYLRLYSTQGFGGLPVGAWSPGFLLGAVYFTSALGLWFLSRSRLADELAIQLAAAAGFTGFGVASFTYFVGRSHPNNLHHIVVPAVATIVVWVDIAARLHGPILRRWISALAAMTLAAIVATGWGNLRAVWPSTALGVLTTAAPPHSFRLLRSDLIRLPRPYPYHSAVADGMRLLARYDPQHRHVVVLLSGELTDEYLLAADRPNAIPLSNPTQEGLLRATRDQVLRAAADLPAGTWVLTDSYPAPPSPHDLSGRVYLELRRRDSLALVARTPSVALLRIR